MPKDITKEDAVIGEVIYQWAVKEYNSHDRDRRWYVLTGITGVALFVYAIIAANYLFALILVLFGIILYMHDLLEPMEVNFAITSTGIILGKKYYRYNELKNFWMIYNPPEVKNLYFSTQNLAKHRLQVPLLNNDPRPIRDYLNKFVMEDLEEEEEPMSDRFGRLFKLH